MMIAGARRRARTAAPSRRDRVRASRRPGHGARATRATSSPTAASAPIPRRVRSAGRCTGSATGSTPIGRLDRRRRRPRSRGSCGSRSGSSLVAPRRRVGSSRGPQRRADATEQRARRRAPGTDDARTRPRSNARPTRPNARAISSARCGCASAPDCCASATAVRSSTGRRSRRRGARAARLRDVRRAGRHIRRSRVRRAARPSRPTSRPRATRAGRASSTETRAQATTGDDDAVRRNVIVAIVVDRRRASSSCNLLARGPRPRGRRERAGRRRAARRTRPSGDGLAAYAQLLADYGHRCNGSAATSRSSRARPRRR